MAERRAKGLIYVGHLPHGFYEKELKEYFSQFGKVTNVRVSRSPKTGRSKGYGFVEFAHSEVAAIAAETMDNYLMFKRRLIAKVVPPERRKDVFKGRPWSTTNYPAKTNRKKEMTRYNSRKGTAKVLQRKVKEKLEKLKSLGIKHRVKIVDNESEKKKS